MRSKRVLGTSAVCLVLVAGLALKTGCDSGVGFLGLQDYQRDLLLGGLAAAVLAGNQGDDGGGTGSPVPDIDGLVGPAGEQGLPGADGTSGVDGADGAAGPAGSAGPAGEQGAQGPVGSAGATGSAGSAGPQGAAGPTGPDSLFTVFVDDFFATDATSYGSLPIELVAVAEPALAGWINRAEPPVEVVDAVAFRVGIPQKYHAGYDVTMRLFFHRMFEPDGDCFAFTVDGRRLRAGVGIDFYDGERRWVRVEENNKDQARQQTAADALLGETTTGRTLVIDLPINSPAGLGFPGDLASADFLGFELATYVNNYAMYHLLGVEFFESPAGTAQTVGATIFLTGDEFKCKCEGNGLDCNENGIPDNCDIESGTSTDCQPNGIPDECEIVQEDDRAAGLLFGSQGGDTCSPLIYTIDPVTGAATVFVDLDPFDIDTCGLTGLALAPGGGTLYVSNRYDPVLFIIDTATTDVTTLVLADPTGRGQDLVLSDLAFLSDGSLIGSAPQLPSLIDIDLTTGATSIRCTTVFEQENIALSGLTTSSQGVVYGSTGGGNQGGPAGTLFTVDLDTQFGGTCGLQRIGNGTGFERVSGLAFAPDGRLLGSTGYGGGDRGGGPELIEIDTSTGVGALVAIIAGPNVQNIDGLAFAFGAVTNDCNGDGILDECQLEGNDCNENGILDECDIANGTSTDANENTVPDECEEIESLTGWWRFEFRAQEACESGFTEDALNELRYLRFDDNNELVENFIMEPDPIERAPNCIQVFYPSDNGPNYFEVRVAGELGGQGELLLDTHREITAHSFDASSGALSLTELVDVPNRNCIGEEGSTFIDAHVSGDTMTGTWEFQFSEEAGFIGQCFEGTDLLCGSVEAQRVDGPPECNIINPGDP